MANCFGITALQCTAGVLVVTYSDAGDCVRNISQYAMLQLATVVEVPKNTATPLPGNYTPIIGDYNLLGLNLESGRFINKNTIDLDLIVTLQYAWMPATAPEPPPVTTTRTAYVVKYVEGADRFDDYPVATSVASNNSNVIQVAVNSIRLKPNEGFTPYAFHNSDETGVTVGDPDAPAITTILIERIFNG